MNKLFQIAVVVFLTASFVITGTAQKQKSKDDYIKEISTLSNTKKPEDLEKAYELSKEFLAKYPKEKGDIVNKIKDFVQRFRDNQFLVYLDQGKTADAFRLGAELLAENADNSLVTMNLAYGGFMALAKNNDKSFNDQTINYANKTISFLEAGKTPSNFAPFKDKDEATSWMYYILGNLQKDTDIKQAAHSFYLATRLETQIKANSFPYYAIATYYEDIYQKLATEYNTKVKTMSEAESKAQLEKVNKVVDLMLDAYARAVKRAEAENAPQKDEWKKRMSDVYKFRKKTDAGFNEFITYINTTELTDPINN